MVAACSTRIAYAGDDVSGWTIDAVQLLPYNYQLCEPFFRFAAGAWRDMPKPAAAELALAASLDCMPESWQLLLEV